jgi:hypothetical protein
MNKLAFFVMLLFLTGCGVESLSFKLSELEYEHTDTGFKVKANNWSDVIINDPQCDLPDLEMEPISISVETENETNNTATIENNTVVLAYS